jgi:hypothetical protein
MRLYSPSPRPNRGARSRALKCGDGWSGALEMRRETLRDRRGDTRAGWGGGRRSPAGRRRRPKPCGPDAPAAHHLGTIGAAPYRGTDRQALQGPISGGEVLRRNLKTGRHLKSLSTGGCTEQASNTARGTPGNRHTVATIACALPLSRAQGHGVLGAPAFRAPSDFRPVARRHQRRRPRAANNRGGGALATADSLVVID